MMIDKKIGLMKRCAKIESDSELAFKKWAKNHNIKVKGKATENQDKYQHIDLFAVIGEKPIGIDLKGLKRETFKGRILVELQNVLGNRGWLFGKADFIAFQISESDFALVARNKLFQLVKGICGFEVFTKGNFNVVMSGERVSNIDICHGSRWYARSDRPKEKVVFVDLEKVLDIKEALS